MTDSDKAVEENSSKLSLNPVKLGLTFMHTTDVVVMVVVVAVIATVVAIALIVATVVCCYCHCNKRSHLCMNNATRSPNQQKDGTPVPKEAEVRIEL